MKKRGVVQFTKSKNAVKGFILTWTDTNIDSEEDTIVAMKVSHKNPVLRLDAPAIWRAYEHDFVKRKPFLWRITVSAYFNYPNGTQQKEERQIVCREIFDRIAVACNDDIHAMKKFGSNLSHTDFVVECLGDRGAKDSDYDQDFERSA